MLSTIMWKTVVTSRMSPDTRKADLDMCDSKNSCQSAASQLFKNLLGKHASVASFNQQVLCLATEDWILSSAVCISHWTGLLVLGFKLFLHICTLNYDKFYSWQENRKLLRHMIGRNLLNAIKQPSEYISSHLKALT